MFSFDLRVLFSYVSLTYINNIGFFFFALLRKKNKARCSMHTMSVVGVHMFFRRKKTEKSRITFFSDKRGISKQRERERDWEKQSLCVNKSFRLLFKTSFTANKHTHAYTWTISVGNYIISRIDWVFLLHTRTINYCCCENSFIKTRKHQL